mmetsp:Transcript_61687/g.121950  ORF Transcript_61687/g.121950 Transcript_61687/m.121950 type:complete len:210 (-) Transcript_61687:327-956(-)
MPRCFARAISSLSSSSLFAAFSSSDLLSSSACAAAFTGSTTSSALALITPLRSASTSSRRLHPAIRICLSCEASVLGQREKYRPSASGIVIASAMKRKTSSMGTSSQVGSSSGVTSRPPPVPSLESVPVRISVHVTGEPVSVASSAAVSAGQDSADRWRNARVTPAACATLSCSFSVLWSALIASQTFAPANASAASPSANSSTSTRPE